MNENILPHDHGNRRCAQSLRGAVERTEDFVAVSDVFKLLSDTNRLRVYWFLCHCEECVVNISAVLKMSSPAVSHHLKMLKDGGLIQSRRDGKEVYYKARECESGKLLHTAIEKIVEMSCPRKMSDECKMCKRCSDEQFLIMNSVHEYLVENLDKRITIEGVAKKFLMNTTTLKLLFKSVYGTSVAAHVKEHRMRKAKELLLNSEMSILQISHSVGYENTGKFAGAFKETYGDTPNAMRRKNKNNL